VYWIPIRNVAGKRQVQGGTDAGESGHLKSSARAVGRGYAPATRKARESGSRAALVRATATSAASWYRAHGLRHVRGIVFLPPCSTGSRIGAD
jgi:hypothetical protein